MCLILLLLFRTFNQRNVVCAVIETAITAD